VTKNQLWTGTQTSQNCDEKEGKKGVFILSPLKVEGAHTKNGSGEEKQRGQGRGIGKTKKNNASGQVKRARQLTPLRGGPTS